MFYIQILTIAVALLFQGSVAQARGPAVEDFVGIEVDHPNRPPQGTEGLFNFEKDMQQYEIQQKSPSTTLPAEAASGPLNFKNIFSIGLVFSLPLIIWAMMIHNLRQKARAESVQNIELLEKYRREREESRKKKDDFRNVS